MACHEIAALRLGLMQILGLKDDAERQHELAELGDAAEKPGPLKSLSTATDMESMARLYAAAVTDLSQKIAATPATDPKLPYLRSLVILTKKVELDLKTTIDGVSRLYRELEEMHDFVHEVYPAE
jgi:hypothetical protein